MDGEGLKLVTKGGECFDAAFRRKQVLPDRDGVLYLFHLNDCRNGRGMRLVSLFRSGPAKLGIQDYESRIENVHLNTLRRAFDLGTLTFESDYDEHRYKELRLDTSDFDIQALNLRVAWIVREGLSALSRLTPLHTPPGAACARRPPDRAALPSQRQWTCTPSAFRR